MWAKHVANKNANIIIDSNETNSEPKTSDSSHISDEYIKSHLWRMNDKSVIISVAVINVNTDATLGMYGCRTYNVVVGNVFTICGTHLITMFLNFNTTRRVTHFIFAKFLMIGYEFSAMRIFISECQA